MWEDRRKELDPKTKNYPKEKLDLLLMIFEKYSEAEIEAESERILSSSQLYAEMSEYDKSLLQAVIVRALNSGNRASLVSVLARKTPRSIASNSIELYLAIRDADNILILLESYRQATAPDNKRVLMQALSGSFKDQRERFKGDEEFLESIKEWYFANRQKLKVNPYYHPLESSGSARNLFVITP